MSHILYSMTTLTNEGSVSVLQKALNAKIWNSSKLRYLQTIFSQLLIVLIYMRANFFFLQIII